MAKHQCVQFGVCPRADSGECFEVNADFKCGRNPEDPDCLSKLEEVLDAGGKGLALKVGIPVALLAVVGVALFFLLGSGNDPKASTPAQKPSAEELLQEVWPWLKAG
ncbi:MAG: hypothetical protein KDN05_00470 [Verrucomicrobiae bacterium]|nr:hypothetical protein [Verrucomicrobiae bacterium]